LISKTASGQETESLIDCVLLLQNSLMIFLRCVQQERPEQQPRLAGWVAATADPTTRAAR
jgi:hypothetical protein